MLSAHINEKEFCFENDLSILEACNSTGAKLPRFCYHENLSIAGNCRMCLVEVEKIIKPIASCSTELISSVYLLTSSPLSLKARENILEFLLLNHPLDCPICDQGGECDLQDQTIFFGSQFGRNYFLKRNVEDKNFGFLIKTIMNRCIHCTRCVRFGEEICGIKFFGTVNRGLKTEISNYVLQLFSSELSTNVVELCPVGALTLKTTPFQVRQWELYSLESIDLTDCIGSNIYILYKGLDIIKIIPKKNILINDSWLSNKARYYFDISFAVLNPTTFFFNFKKKINSSLFLLNSDLDLQTLFFLKNLNFKNSKFIPKLLNSTSNKTNFYFIGFKSTINQILCVKQSVCFLISCNLQTEVPILNIKLRAKILSNNIFVHSGGPYIKSNFPVKFLKFSNIQILFLFLGKHFYLSFFFKYKLLFFSNKSFLDRFDIYLYYYLYFKFPNNLFFNISSFCNTESTNFLNFKKFNFKEFLISTTIFGFNLDDTFLLRKILFYNNNFFWVNRFPSLILSLLSKNSWLLLDNNQSSGYYLNIEQRVQKLFLINNNTKLTIKNYLLKILNNNLKIDIILKSIKLSFKTLIVYFSSFIEIYNFSILLITNKVLKIFYSLFFFNCFFKFKQYLLKPVLENTYRSSFQLKHSIFLQRNTQLLNLENLL